MADLIEVSGSQLPGLGGKVDVVAVMHLGQMVEAAGLHTQNGVDAPLPQGRQTLCVMQQSFWDILPKPGILSLLPLMLACIAAGICPCQLPQHMPFTTVLHQIQHAIVLHRSMPHASEGTGHQL